MPLILLLLVVYSDEEVEGNLNFTSISVVSTRSRKDQKKRHTRREERCQMLRMAGQSHGFRFERDQGGEVVGVGGVPDGGSRNGTEENSAGPLCLVHFQGDSKQLIPGFSSFLNGETQEFILP